MKISVNCHSSIQVDDLFFDPFKISSEPCDEFDTKLMKMTGEKRILGKNFKAKIVFLTHTHYDHLSEDDLLLVANDHTKFVAPLDAKDKLDALFPKNEKHFVVPNQKLNVGGVEIETFPAFNTNKNFHKPEYGWVGYKVNINGETCAVLGDCDALNEHKSLHPDVLFVPIGGTYTMNAAEAAALTNTIRPKMVVPVHYNTLVGSKEDEKIFASNLDPSIALCPLVK